MRGRQDEAPMEIVKTKILWKESTYGGGGGGEVKMAEYAYMYIIGRCWYPGDTTVYWKLHVPQTWYMKC